MAKTHQKNLSKEVESKSNFVGYSLRISFWIMILLWILNVVFNPKNYLSGFMIIFTLMWIASIFFTFVSSIIHLVKYKKKTFAVISLVMSSYLVLTFLVGFIIGIVRVAA